MPIFGAWRCTLGRSDTSRAPASGDGGSASDGSGNAGLSGAGFGGVTFHINIETAIGSDLSKVGEQIGPAVLKYMQALQKRKTGTILPPR